MLLLSVIDNYKHNFLNDPFSSSMSWEDGTVYFYYSIIIVALFIGLILESGKKRFKMIDKYKPLFIFLGVLLACILGFRGQNVGKDTTTYIQSFYDSHSYVWDSSGLEPGFMLVNKLLGLLFHDGRAIIIIYSFFILFFTFSAIWRYRSVNNLFFTIGFYVGLYFFPALNLMRLYLAASFMLWSFPYLLNKQFKKYILCIIVASLFHMSSLIMFMPLLYYLIYKKSPLAAFLVLGVALLFVVSVASHFADYLAIQRYAEYGENNEYEGGFGIMLFVDYLPGLFLVWYIWKYKIKSVWSDLTICFTFVALFFRSVAYYIIIAGRLGAYFMVIYIFLVPFFLNEMKMRKSKLYYPFIIFLFVFLFFKVDLYFKGYLASDGIMPYYFFWND